MSFCENTGSNAAPWTGQQLCVHTLPFAFRAPEEDDESVKMSNITSRRASAFSPALLAPRTQSNRPQNTNFYSIQTNGFISPRILQPTENTALPFFYSIQMKSYQALITNHQSPLTNTRRIP
jgi:hypothetical protein